MKTAVFSNDKRSKPFIKSLLDCGFAVQVVFTEFPEYFFLLSFHRFTKGFFLTSGLKDTHPTLYYALKHRIPVFNKSTSASKIELILKKKNIDYALVFLFGMLKNELVNAHRFINFHPSYLPENRGASPSNWAIRNGQPETGLTIHLLNEKVDAGEIIFQHKISLSGIETTEILNAYLLALGERYFIRLMTQLELGIPIKTLKNDIAEGSYQKPFNKVLNYFTSENTYKEVMQIIRSSQGGSYTALFKDEAKEHFVLDAIEIDASIKVSRPTMITKDGIKLILICKA